ALKAIGRPANMWMVTGKESMLSRSLQAGAWLVPVLFFACASPKTSPLADHEAKPTTTVYVIHHGSLHTGLTLRPSDIPPGHWPASHDFAGSRYIEVGWGDDDGYRKPLTTRIALKALMGDSRTVLLADGFNAPIAR